MIEVEQAVSMAKEELNRLFPAFAAQDLRLEEAETPLSGGARWKLTFSAAVSEEVTGNTLADFVRPRRRRKLVELQENSGALIAIKAA